MTTNNLKSLVGFIYNLSLIEEETAQLYENIAEKIENPLIKALLSEISLDSQKHYRLLKGILDSMPKIDLNAKDSQKQIKKAKKAMNDFLMYFNNLEVIEESHLPELTEKLDILESQMGEEYEILEKAKSLIFFASEIEKKYNFESQTFKKIFETIIIDENNHREILESIRNIIQKKEKELLAEDLLLNYRRVGVPRMT